tara:strand:- start:281 stop:565 length:285 start_codon:yes stop_codon:yes gene_type:complete
VLEALTAQAAGDEAAAAAQVEAVATADPCAGGALASLVCRVMPSALVAKAILHAPGQGMLASALWQQALQLRPGIAGEASEDALQYLQHASVVR